MSSSDWMYEIVSMLFSPVCDKLVAGEKTDNKADGCKDHRDGLKVFVDKTTHVCSPYVRNT